MIVSGRAFGGRRPGEGNRHAAASMRIVDIRDAAIATGERRAGLGIGR